jgi:hypothetical protein
VECDFSGIARSTSKSGLPPAPKETSAYTQIDFDRTTALTGVKAYVNVTQDDVGRLLQEEVKGAKAEAKPTYVNVGLTRPQTKQTYVNLDARALLEQGMTVVVVWGRETGVDMAMMDVSVHEVNMERHTHTHTDSLASSCAEEQEKQRRAEALRKVSRVPLPFRPSNKVTGRKVCDCQVR